MGLAASQAKLLSLTCRISDNELRAQSLTAAKMALASQTSEASRKYINALGTNEFIYRNYDDAGNKVYTALTGAQLSTYAPLKNQYALINTDGQVLVSELDAANYEDSADINEFLIKYGVDPIDTGETRTIKNPEYVEAYEEWEKEYQDWLNRKPDEKIRELITPAWDEEVPHTVGSSLYEEFIQNASSCFQYTLGYVTGNKTNCYMHVLTDLIGPGEHTTSSGQTFTAYPDSNGWDWNRTCHPITPGRAALTEAIKTAYCSGDVIPGGQEDVSTVYTRGNDTVTVGGPSSDPNMTVYQRAVDLLWELHTDYDGSPTGGIANPDSHMKFFYFVEHDLKSMDEETEVIHHPDEWEVRDNPEYERWLEEEPDPISIPATIDERVYEYSDKDKAQWYVNLWHRMNGPSDYKDGEETITTSHTDTEVSSNGVTRTTTTEKVTRNRWDILEDGLMNSQDWLKYALESGAVTLERVNFSNPTEEGSGLKDATWTSIQYNNALDISEQLNETAIARAEAEYQQKTREIENKDKQIDSMIKLLDSEHSALQTEYESVKTVISKNTERTLKIYSA